MDGGTTIISDPDDKYPDKKFTFDFSYWSHDGYRERDDGYLEPADQRYADQSKVFDDLGRGVLENAWKGFNCSLFAYGQTGSGKSYSMVGFDSNKGIVPRVCEELFRGISEHGGGDVEFQVSVAMIEVYNDVVKDLLSKRVAPPGGGLKVRQAPKKGFVVVGLESIPVQTSDEINFHIGVGNKRRTIVATKMNDVSSRGHTMFVIKFVQVRGEQTVESEINLVDLAGSERAKRVGGSGGRLKEGALINKSLSCLGNCIKAIVNGDSHVPYRDSVLTKLLKKALGGNSKTVMMAALSPAAIDYEETLSTLRFADRAKQIKTKAVVNEDHQDRMIRIYEEEIQKLRQQVASNPPTEGWVSMEEVEKMRREFEDQMRMLEDQLEDSNKTWREKMEEQRVETMRQIEEDNLQKEKATNTPHLWNLNMDQVLCAVKVYFTNPGTSVIGGGETANIKIDGVSDEIAEIKNEENDRIYILPMSEIYDLRVNGMVVHREAEMRHNDRILLGTNNLFVFAHPRDLKSKEEKGIKINKVTFEAAQAEIRQHTEELEEDFSTFVWGVGSEDGVNDGKVDLKQFDDKCRELLEILESLQEQIIAMQRLKCSEKKFRNLCLLEEKCLEVCGEISSKKLKENEIIDDGKKEEDSQRQENVPNPPQTTNNQIPSQVEAKSEKKSKFCILL
ncbi:kinesin-like protein KIF28 [Ciona intestinalis]